MLAYGDRQGVIPEGDAVKCQAWVNATTAFTHGVFTPAHYAEREQRYGGVEIVVETWREPGSQWEDQRIRITSDVARTPATALIRAAFPRGSELLLLRDLCDGVPR